jgi:hypothetical protein
MDESDDSSEEGDVGNDRSWDDLELEFHQLVSLYTFLFDKDDNSRKAFWDHDYLGWSQHVRKLCHEGHFTAKYRMPEEAFNNLVQMLLMPFFTRVTPPSLGSSARRKSTQRFLSPLDFATLMVAHMMI